ENDECAQDRQGIAEECRDDAIGAAEARLQARIGGVIEEPVACGHTEDPLPNPPHKGEGAGSVHMHTSCLNHRPAPSPLWGGLGRGWLSKFISIPAPSDPAPDRADRISC